MWRQPALLLLLGAIVGGLESTDAPHVYAAESHSLGQESTGQAGNDVDPDQLVLQLGDRSFKVRRMATSRLVELGAASLEALERGVQSDDREVSFRSGHVLTIVREQDFQRRLRAFAAGQELSDKYHLPGWPQFAKNVGVDREARLLFVEMQRAEPELLSVLEHSPKELGDTLTERIAFLQTTRALSQQSEQPSLGTIAAVLFVLNCHEVELPSVLVQSIGSYFRYPAFESAIRNGPKQALLRKMLGTWIEKAGGWDAYHGMYLSMNYDMPVGLSPAKRILQAQLDGHQQETYFIAYAMHTLARFGSEADIELVLPLLGDETPFGGAIAVAGKGQYRTQIRDIALATVIHLAKLNHKDFGFERYRTNSTLVFQTTSAAFENDEKRDEAIKKWMEYHRNHLSTSVTSKE